MTVTLLEIVTELSNVYDDYGCVIWLQARTFLRDGDEIVHPVPVSALDLIAAGRSQEVFDAIEQLTSGAMS
jgi:hypothetical protein